MVFIKTEVTVIMHNIDQSGFKTICIQAGYDLNESEFINLKSAFEDACHIIQPLNEIDLTDTEMILKFYQEIRD